MAIITSEESLRLMRQTINSSAEKIFSLNNEVTNFINNIDWKDDKGSELAGELRKISQTILKPLPELKATRDKIDKLINIASKYNSISWNN